MPSRFNLPQDPEHPTPGDKRVDTSKRYDVYSTQFRSRFSLLRNVFFKRVVRLHGKASSEYAELEQADGQTVFVKRYKIIMFCEPGTTPSFEELDI